MSIIPDLRSILALPWAYRLLRRLFGNEANRSWFVNWVLALRGGERVVDVGCGTADILELLPNLTYVGLDVSETYIESARRRYGARAVFLSGRVDNWSRDPRTNDADVVLVNGVLHHVDDDEAKRILQFAYHALKEDGRFVFYEPCYLIWQSKISMFFMSRDRGRNIRFEHEWKALVGSIFPYTSTTIVNGVNRFGYICIVGQCYKSKVAANGQIWNTGSPSRFEFMNSAAAINPGRNRPF